MSIAEVPSRIRVEHYVDRKAAAIARLTRPLIDKNPQAYLHTWQVAAYSVMLSRRAGFDQQNQELIHNIAMLHDIGKADETFISELSGLQVHEANRDIFNTHTDIGAKKIHSEKEALGDKLTKMAAFVAKHHHYLTNGNGKSHLKELQEFMNSEAMQTEFPQRQERHKLYEILMIIKLADAFDSCTNRHALKIPERDNGFPISFEAAVRSLQNQFDNEGQAAEKQRFDIQFYGVFEEFGKDIIEFAQFMDQ